MNRTRKELIEAARAIALAPLEALHYHGNRLAHLAEQGVVDPVEAADYLYDMAVANKLDVIHGDDRIAEILADAFGLARDYSASPEKVA